MAASFREIGSEGERVGDSELKEGRWQRRRAVAAEREGNDAVVQEGSGRRTRVGNGSEQEKKNWYAHQTSHSHSEGKQEGDLLLNLYLKEIDFDKNRYRF